MRPLVISGYVFVCIISRWYAARWVPGLIGFVMGGKHPPRVPDAVISELKGRERNGITALLERPVSL
jgi:transcription antitermination factor NusG